MAIVGAGVFAITRLGADSADGGAASPQAAGEAFLAAIDDEDVLGMIDVLLPGERETLRGPATDLVDELRRLEVLSDDASLSAIDGVDLVVEDSSVDVRPTNVDDIVNLDITASVSGSIDGEALPIGDWIRDNLDRDLSELDTESPEATPDTIPVTAVEQDGRWYLSLFYTAAESARAATGEDIPADGITPTGGDTPEEAVDAFLDGVEQLDLSAVIATLNPDEFEALQRYAPLFLDDAQASLDEVDVDLSISDREYDVSGSGDSRSVTVGAVSLDVAAEGESATLELRDGCWIITAPEADEAVNTCELADGVPSLDEVLEDAQPIEDLLESFSATFDDYENPGLVVREVDGRWYVSPMATVSEQVLAVIRALSREEIEDLQGQLDDVIGSIDEQVLDGGVAIPTLDDFERPDAESPTATTIDGDDAPSGSDATEGDASPADGSIPPDPAEACYGEADAAAAADCFQDLVAAGDIDTLAMPWYLRFPDCGLAEIGWSGDYYSLPDADFVAIVTEAAPCFQALVEAGEAEEFELPVEINSPECLQGRNWYTATDDEYLDAFDECAFG